MREILFRGKTYDGHWIYGDLIHTGDRTFILASKGGNWSSEDFFLVEPESVGQYTGLNDCEGNKIFEGDILMVTDEDFSLDEIETGFGNVEFIEGLWYVDGELNNALHELRISKYFEIIGNVKDNDVNQIIEQYEIYLEECKDKLVEPLSKTQFYFYNGKLLDSFQHIPEKSSYNHNYYYGCNYEEFLVESDDCDYNVLSIDGKWFGCCHTGQPIEVTPYLS